MTAPTFRLTVHADDIALIEQLWKQLRRPDEHVPGSIDINAGVVHLEVDLRHPAATSERSCRECGCTTDRSCPGGCSWIGPDLCSACGELADFERGSMDDLRSAGFDQPVVCERPRNEWSWDIQRAEVAVVEPTVAPNPDEVGLDPVRFDETHPAMVLDDLHRALVPDAESHPLLDRTAAWETTWRHFEGYSTRRLIIDAMERLTGQSVVQRDCVDERVDTALDQAVRAMDRALEHWTPPDDESGDLKSGDETLPVAVHLDEQLADATGEEVHTVDVGQVTVADPGPEPDGAAEIVDESGDAGGREAPEGTSSPGTSPDSSTTIDPTLPLSEQVVAVLEAAPDVKFTAPDVDLLLARHDVKSTSTALSTAAKRGRIVRLARGLYQANGQTEPDTGGLRDRITKHLRHGVASSTSIAEALDEVPVEVVNELRRMTEAGLVRIKGGGWTLLETRDDLDARIAERRRAAAEAM